MKSVIEHFNIENKEHVAAVQYYNRNGSFPSGFLLVGVEFHPNDMQVVNEQLVNTGITLLGDENKADTPKPTEPLDSSEAPGGTDESIDLGETDEKE